MAQLCNWKKLINDPACRIVSGTISQDQHFIPFRQIVHIQVDSHGGRTEMTTTPYLTGCTACGAKTRDKTEARPVRSCDKCLVWSIPRRRTPKTGLAMSRSHPRLGFIASRLQTLVSYCITLMHVLSLGPFLCESVVESCAVNSRSLARCGRDSLASAVIHAFLSATGVRNPDLAGELPATLP